MSDWFKARSCSEDADGFGVWTHCSGTQFTRRGVAYLAVPVPPASAFAQVEAYGATWTLCGESERYAFTVYQKSTQLAVSDTPMVKSMPADSLLCFSVLGRVRGGVVTGWRALSGCRYVLETGHWNDPRLHGAPAYVRGSFGDETTPERRLLGMCVCMPDPAWDSGGRLCIVPADLLNFTASRLQAPGSANEVYPPSFPLLESRTYLSELDGPDKRLTTFRALDMLAQQGDLRELHYVCPGIQTNLNPPDATELQQTRASHLRIVTRTQEPGVEYVFARAPKFVGGGGTRLVARVSQAELATRLPDGLLGATVDRVEALDGTRVLKLSDSAEWGACVMTLRDARHSTYVLRFDGGSEYWSNGSYQEEADEVLEVARMDTPDRPGVEKPLIEPAVEVSAAEGSPSSPSNEEAFLPPEREDTPPLEETQKEETPKKETPKNEVSEEVSEDKCATFEDDER